MGIFDRFHGLHESEPGFPPLAAVGPTTREAVAQYRTLLQHAPPETIEQAHASAFAQLTPAQRQEVFVALCHEMPAFEWETGVRYADEPRSLARMVTRAELEHPGTLERVLLTLELPVDESNAGGFAAMLVGSWAACQFFADARKEAGTDERASIDAILGRDILISEESMQADEAGGRYDDAPTRRYRL